MSVDEGAPPGAPSEVLRHREALEHTAPPSAFVDESFRVVHLSVTAGRYLQPSAEPLAHDITEVAREELRFDLRTALHRVFSHGEASLSPPIVMRFAGAQRRVQLQVRLARRDPNAARAAIVFFFEGEALDDSLHQGTSREEPAPENQIRTLRQELQLTQSQLRASREECRRAEDALREGEARLRAVCDGVADAIVSVDETGAVRAVNKSASAMFGYAVEELLGAGVSTLIPGEDHRGGMAKNVGVAREVEAARKDGSTFSATLRVSEVRHHDERLFLNFLRELSEKPMLEACLRELQGGRLPSMAKMASTLAHELNQPLSAAANYMEAGQCLLRSCRERPPQLEEALDNAASQMLRAGRIVSRLRDFISLGDPPNALQSLHAIIRQTSEFAAPLMKEHEVALTLHLDAGRDLVLAETAPIQQVLVHLIRNACEAIGESKIRKLTIATTLKDEMLRVDVVDTRPSKAVDANFFEPFDSSKSDGLGAGLSIVRSIVEAHQGSLWAESDAGNGARFSFTLPLAEATVGEPAKP